MKTEGQGPRGGGHKISAESAEGDMFGVHGGKLARVLYRGKSGERKKGPRTTSRNGGYGKTMATIKAQSSGSLV